MQFFLETCDDLVELLGSGKVFSRLPLQSLLCVVSCLCFVVAVFFFFFWAGVVIYTVHIRGVRAHSSSQVEK